MSMRPSPIEPVPEETARVARAAFRKGNLLMRIRDDGGVLSGSFSSHYYQ
jgi:transposase